MQRGKKFKQKGLKISCKAQWPNAEKTSLGIEISLLTLLMEQDLVEEEWCDLIDYFSKRAGILRAEKKFMIGDNENYERIDETKN